MRLRIFISCVECQNRIAAVIDVPGWPVVVNGICDNGHEYPYVHRTDAKGRMIQEWHLEDQIAEAHERAA